MLPQCVCPVSTEAPERHERTCENEKEKKRRKKDSFFCQALRGGQCEHDGCQWKFVIPVSKM